MEQESTKIGQIRPEAGFLPGNQKPDEHIERPGGAREGNSRPDPRQLSLFCPCGALPPLTAGLCSSCYWKWRHSLRFFDGRRDEVLERDGRRCRACGSDHRIGVHHRQRGSNLPSSLIVLCAACHAQVHRLLSIWKWTPALLAELWAEQHPGAPVQMQFDGPPAAQPGLLLEGREALSAKRSLPGGQIG